MRAAEDCDADALMDVDYSEEVLPRAEQPGAAAQARLRHRRRGQAEVGVIFLELF